MATIRRESVAKDTIRATRGEDVWVLLNMVKPDKLEQHKHFVHDILIPAGEQVDPAAVRHTRFLHPSEPNENGTYTTVFIMDPVIEGAEYNILTLLTKAYGEEKAQEYIRLWDDALAIPQDGYSLIQAI